MSNDTKGVETKVEETTNQEALLDEENKEEVKKTTLQLPRVKKPKNLK